MKFMIAHINTLSQIQGINSGASPGPALLRAPRRAKVKGIAAGYPRQQGRRGSNPVLPATFARERIATCSRAHESWAIKNPCYFQGFLLVLVVFYVCQEGFDVGGAGNLPILDELDFRNRAHVELLINFLLEVKDIVIERFERRRGFILGQNRNIRLGFN
jgi:hypothetical protein